MAIVNSFLLLLPCFTDWLLDSGWSLWLFGRRENHRSTNDERRYLTLIFLSKYIKVKLLKEEFGYDDAFNYNTKTSFDDALTKYFPDGIDVYLDNVGGEMLEAVLNHVNKHAHIVLCGMISQYNKVWTERYGVRNLLNMVGKEVKMEGYLIRSYMDRFPDFTKDMETYIKQGKITYKHMIYYGIDSFLESLGSLFSSSNIGKVVIQVNSPH